MEKVRDRAGFLIVAALAFCLALPIFPGLETAFARLLGPVQPYVAVAAAAAILVVAALVIVKSSMNDGGFTAGQRPQSAGAEMGRVAPMIPDRRATPSPMPIPEAVPEVSERVAITIRVRPEMECWIHYRDHNGAAGGKLLAGGSEERIELAGPVKLTVGDAGAASLEVGGQVYENLGRPGQVIHTEVSTRGLIVLGPRPRND